MVFHLTSHLRTFNWRCQGLNLGNETCLGWGLGAGKSSPPSRSQELLSGMPTSQSSCIFHLIPGNAVIVSAKANRLKTSNALHVVHVIWVVGRKNRRWSAPWDAMIPPSPVFCPPALTLAYLPPEPGWRLFRRPRSRYRNSPSPDCRSCSRRGETGQAWRWESRLRDSA